MSEQVIYRKHRPQRFGEVVGQQHVVKSISYAVAQNDPAHAYLFSGQRGVGKTTLARLLAKAINCERVRGNDIGEDETGITAKHFEPCNECKSCRAIDKGAMDVQEMDAASNRKVEHIEELIDSVKYPPSRLEKKVIIIDEAHMLSKAAFNALLKTLEEPPEHAIFILATTEVEKVPDTIVSRCQRFDFHKLNLAQIQKRLEGICQKEGIEAEPQALRIVAVNSGGSMRDAESLLQQLLSQTEDELGVEQTKEMLGVVDEQLLRDFVKDIFAGDSKQAFAKINQILTKGKEINQFTRQVIRYLRFVMLAKAGGEKLLSQEFVTDDVTEWSLDLAENLSSTNISAVLDQFSKALNTHNEYPLPQIALEVAVVQSVDLLEEK